MTDSSHRVLTTPVTRGMSGRVPPCLPQSACAAAPDARNAGPPTRTRSRRPGVARRGSSPVAPALPRVPPKCQGTLNICARRLRLDRKAAWGTPWPSAVVPIKCVRVTPAVYPPVFSGSLAHLKCLPVTPAVYPLPSEPSGATPGSSRLFPTAFPITPASSPPFPKNSRLFPTFLPPLPHSPAGPKRPQLGAGRSGRRPETGPTCRPRERAAPKRPERQRGSRGARWKTISHKAKSQ